MEARRWAPARTKEAGYALGKDPANTVVVIDVTWGTKDRWRVGNLLMRVASESKTSSCIEAMNVSETSPLCERESLAFKFASPLPLSSSRALLSLGTVGVET